MKNIQVKYNPYRMETTVIVDGIDMGIKKSSLKKLLEEKTPLQTWIEPIAYRDWQGFVDEVFDTKCNDEANIYFTGRKIDFDDLRRSLNSQNTKRGSRNRIKFNFVHSEVLDDKEHSKNIESIVGELTTDRFKELVTNRSSKELNNHYANLEVNYQKAKESEFYIVFSGIYSSGKSTIINTLTRHCVLPVSDNTCTSKNCRICHDPSLGKKVSLLCLDKNKKKVFDKEIFDSDAKCLARFEEISPIQEMTNKKNEKAKSEKYSSVGTIELGMDLSHLYPESVDKEKFKLVIIDTPGVNSSVTANGEINKHADTALNAVSDDCKPMVVFCAPAEYKEDESIGNFMSRILGQTQEDNGGFNDRFLFVLNKCDALKFKPNESPDDTKMRFSSYITNTDKWGKKNERKVSFVPRIFLTSAYLYEAIQAGAPGFTIEELRSDSNKRSLRQIYTNFKENIDCNDQNYYLSNYCDISEYRKNEIEADFQKALEKGNDVRAVELQCGMIPLEIAIKDYIARYAYPIKVRSLLETFDDILDDVLAYEAYCSKKLKEMVESLGKNQESRRGAEESIKSIEDKNNELNNAKIRASSQLNRLGKIMFDRDLLLQARKNFENELEESPSIKKIRNNKTVSTKNGNKSEIEREVANLLKNAFQKVKEAQAKIESTMESIVNTNEEQLDKICNVLVNIATDLKDSGVLEFEGYSFTSSIGWTKKFKNLDIKSVRQAMINSIMESRTVPQSVRNQTKIKYQNLSWWHFIKRHKAKKMSDYITIYTEVDGCYSVAAARDELAKIQSEMESDCDELKNLCESRIETLKKEAAKLANDLIQSIEECYNEIQEQNKRIKELIQDESDISDAQARYCETINWLSGLTNIIKGV